MKTIRRLRKTSTSWRLVDVMASRDIRTIRKLHEMLAPYVELSYHRTRRLVLGSFTDLPSLEVLEALCYALHCNINEIVRIDHRPRESQAATTELKTPKPRRNRDNFEQPMGYVRLGDPTGIQPLEIHFDE